jgi:conjugal transfer pilus assembly protein TraD
MTYDPLAYEMPWRPNYEMSAVVGWVAASGVALAVQQMTDMPPEPFYWMTGICGVMTMARLPKAIKMHLLQKHLKGRDLEFISIRELQKKIKASPEEMWLGYGFAWENRHAQRVFEILKRDWSSIVGTESTTSKVVRTIRGRKKKEVPIGQPWIHGVEPKEEHLMQPLKHTEGHSLIVGTTGSGKTRMFDTLISQAILRGEAVIIIDPKGDKEMRDNARRACEAMGQAERFVSFHPAFPEESVRIDPLRNFTRVTEIASRLAALIPSEGGGDPFKSFGWQALNNIAQGLILAYDRPNLIKLRRFLEGGADGLVIKAVQAYSERVMPDWKGQSYARINPCAMLFSACHPNDLNGSPPPSEGMSAAKRLAISVTRVKFLRGSIRTDSSGNAGWKETNRSACPIASQARRALSRISLSPFGSMIITASPRRMAWEISVSNIRVLPEPVVPTMREWPSVCLSGCIRCSSFGSTPWIHG